MFIQGLAGVSRRLYDGGAQYAHAKPVAATTNLFMSMSRVRAARRADAVHLQLLLQHAHSGKTASAANVWDATTLEWAATTSPPLAHGNFAVLPVVYRGPYEYSVPGYTTTGLPAAASR